MGDPALSGKSYHNPFNNTLFFLWEEIALSGSLRVQGGRLGILDLHPPVLIEAEARGIKLRPL